MTTIIENKFFEIYKYGSVADRCLFCLRWENNIKEYRTKNGWRLTDAGAKNLKELPAKLFTAATNIDFSAEEVIEEIRGNVDILEENATKLHRYLRHDVMKPLEYISGQSELIGLIKCSIIRLSHPFTEEVEAFGILFDLLEEFINRLDALLLEYGIDFMELQKNCGITLKEQRSIDDVAPYVGSPELAQRLINALTPGTAADTNSSQQPAHNKSGYDLQPFSVPESLQTAEAEKMLKAIESVNGYKGIVVLNRDTTPWSVSAKTDWAYVAQELTKRLKLADRVDWQMWANLIGTPRNTLRNASRSSYAAAGSNAILTALNNLD